MKLLIITFLSILIARVESQNLCKFIGNGTDTKVENIQNKAIYLQHFSTAKCLRAGNFGHISEAKVFIDECSYWTTPSQDQKFYLNTTKVSKDGKLIKVNSGLSESLCFAVSKDSSLKVTQCATTNFDQIFKVKEVKNHPDWFLLQQASSMKCLMPYERKNGAAIKLNHCNAFVTEQLWKICLTNS